MSSWGIWSPHKLTPSDLEPQKNLRIAFGDLPPCSPDNRLRRGYCRHCSLSRNLEKGYWMGRLPPRLLRLFSFWSLPEHPPADALLLAGKRL